MKACKACAVQVQQGREFCPLCGEVLPDAANPTAEPGGAAACAAMGEYPDLSRRMAGYSLVRRIILFASLLICGISILLNLLLTPSFLWCLIVLAATVYAWATVPPLLRQGINFAARVVAQVLLTALLAVALDIIIGWRAWSVNFVIPGLLLAGILSVGLMMLFNRTSRPQFILYQVLLGLFGFAPLALYLTGLATNLVMVLITVGVAFASLLATLVFGDRTVKSEFKRRFHF